MKFRWLFHLVRPRFRLLFPAIENLNYGISSLPPFIPSTPDFRDLSAKSNFLAVMI